MADDASALEAQPGTPLDGLRKEFAKKLEPKRLKKRFPFPDGKLVGEYRLAPKGDVRSAAETQNDEFLLAQCLVGILVEDADHALAGADGLVPLGAWSGKTELDPLRFDNRLAEVLGFPPGPPDQIALRLFEGNDLVLAQQVGEIAEWSLDSTNEAYADFPIAA
jgi:hypothetical protein